MQVDAIGLADMLDNKIYIEKDLPETSKPRILVHEAAHIALWHAGIDDAVSNEMREVLCQVFSALYFELKKQKI